MDDLADRIAAELIETWPVSLGQGGYPAFESGPALADAVGSAAERVCLEWVRQQLASVHVAVACPGLDDEIVDVCEADADSWPCETLRLFGVGEEP